MNPVKLKCIEISSWKYFNRKKILSFLAPTILIRFVGGFSIRLFRVYNRYEIKTTHVTFDFETKSNG